MTEKFQFGEWAKHKYFPQIGKLLIVKNINIGWVLARYLVSSKSGEQYLECSEFNISELEHIMEEEQPVLQQNKKKVLSATESENWKL
jgi:hypothetical protein